MVGSFEAVLYFTDFILCIYLFTVSERILKWCGQYLSLYICVCVCICTLHIILHQRSSTPSHYFLNCCTRTGETAEASNFDESSLFFSLLFYKKWEKIVGNVFKMYDLKCTENKYDSNECDQLRNHSWNQKKKDFFFPFLNI